MVRTWIHLILISFLCVGLYIYTHAYIALLTLSVILFLGIASFAVLPLIRRHIKLTLEPGWPVYKGDEGMINVKVQNKGLFPAANITCRFLFYNRLTQQQMTKETYVRVTGKGDVVVPLSFTSEHIGKIDISVQDIKVYDYLQLFSLQVPSDAAQATYIIPRHIPINIIGREKPAGPDDGARHLNGKKAQEGTDTIGVKEYTVGDDVKHIHWKLTSKFQFPVIKEYNEAVDNQILLFYDAAYAGSPQEINTRIDAFLSLSHALIDHGYDHTLAWTVEDDRNIQMEDIHTREELTSLQAVILEMQHQYDSDESVYEMVYRMIHRYSHVYVVTSEAHQRLRDFSEEEHITILAYTNDRHTYQENAGGHMSFSSGTLQDDLRYLTI